jgi:adenine-specific DNA-methyltransferase
MPTLNWIGKEKVINHHQDVPYRVLEHKYGFTAESGQQPDDTNTGNLILHGDNLEALKSLLPKYESKVKCIYIDPPYNTGNEGWAYNDNVNDPKIRKWLDTTLKAKENGKDAPIGIDDLARHDKWLCMMYPRLKLLHKLLADDGAIFISIDDNEHANLKLIMDEIFGLNGFVDNIIWQKMFAPKNTAKYFSANHDFIMVYAKFKEKWVRNPLNRTEEQNARYNNPDNDSRGVWTSGDLSARNPYSLGIYPINTPSGRVIDGPPKNTFWRVSKDKFDQLDLDGRIWWGKDGSNVPRLKRFLTEIQEGIVPQTIWLNTDVGNTQDAKKEFNKILFDSELKFDTPKPVNLIERVLEIASHKDSIVLDSFAGSGTTAHAVLNLNKSDGGNRKFILVELEDYAETITSERVKRVINGYSDKEGTGGGFDYYELGNPLFIGDNNEFLNEEVETEKIREYVWYSETRTAYEKPDAVNENPYFLGLKEETAYYFIYEKESQTTLDFDTLSTITTKAGQYVVYADNCLLPKDFMMKQNIIFKKIPRDVTRF